MLPYPYNPWRFCVAPMVDQTDRHCRYFHRLLSQRARLYTEMLTTGAILHGGRSRLLGFAPAEHPLAVQLGGSDPRALAVSARICADWGYDEINLNIGCPSQRVQSGRFGACLMAEPDLVAECVAALRAAVALPVTIKCRLGIDNRDSYELLCYFIERSAQAGCQVFIIHARQAWLRGLSPQENRHIPPLHYDRVYRLKQDFPKLTIVINGGIATLDQAQIQLGQVDGVMLGRAAYDNPFLLTEVDKLLFADPSAPLGRAPLSRHEAIMALLPYIEQQLQQGVRLMTLLRPVLGLFQGVPGARAWRRYLSEQAPRASRDAGIATVRAALARVPAPPEITPQQAFAAAPNL